MKLAAVATVYNEADIINASLEHLYLEGVDQVYIAHGPSTDGTLDVLKTWGAQNKPDRDWLQIVDDPSPIHHQPLWISALAHRAYEDGADWVIPFDADEFWYAMDGSTLAETLSHLPTSVHTVSVPMIRHYDWNYRMAWRTLPKVAFRAEAGVRVANGNHSCSIQGYPAEGIVSLRELCYRGFNHFVRKTRERCATLDPTLPASEGTHQTKYRGMSDYELWVEWVTYSNIARTYDPVPSQVTPRFGRLL